MNLRDLEYALAVAEHGHFSRAAEACEVSQPTLSGQIRKLEDELGLQIFERDGRHVRVTTAGETVLAYARQALGATADLRHAARASRDPLVGALRLGIISTLAPYLLPHFLPALQARHPEMPLWISEELTSTSVARVHDGSLDAAIVATDHSAEGLDEIALFDEPLSVALHPAHPLARHERIDAALIDPAELLLLTEGHCLRGHALALCAQANVPARDRTSDLRATSLETLLNLVEANYGITVLPALALGASQRRAGTIVTRPFAGPNVSRRVRLISRPRAPRRAALGALAAAIVDVLPDDVSAIR